MCALFHMSVEHAQEQLYLVHRLDRLKPLLCFEVTRPRANIWLKQTRKQTQLVDPVYQK